ncbi:hypothetical protein QJS66_08285 [Kocuria rhizophila]|nr:hypothetical protein QJS66_08285 [Kocuria rhizophila]
MLTGPARRSSPPFSRRGYRRVAGRWPRTWAPRTGSTPSCASWSSTGGPAGQQRRFRQPRRVRHARS